MWSSNKFNPIWPCSVLSILNFIYVSPFLWEHKLALRNAALCYFNYIHNGSSFTRYLVGSCYSIFSFMCMFYRLLFVLFPFTFGHCVGPSLTYGFWLLLWYLLAIVLALHWLTDSDYSFGIFKLFEQAAINVIVYVANKNVCIRTLLRFHWLF